MADATQILLKEEVQAVVEDLHRRSQRSLSSWLNLTIFRLSCCCGIRRSEMCGLNVGDVVASGPRPGIRIRKDITKGRLGCKRARLVPLWWDAGTLKDIAGWHAFRLESGAVASDPFLCNHRAGRVGHRLHESGVRRRWRTAIRVLGPQRVEQLSIHCGRHSFISHAQAAGRSVVEVQKAAGHVNLATTSIYSHLVERENVPDIFG